MPLFERSAAPDDTEEQVDVSPVVNIDDVADSRMAENGDRCNRDVGLPGPIS
jgi:hypothetical protein